MTEKEKLIKILRRQTLLVSRLLGLVDCIKQDIGCETPDVIWPVLGPVNDEARDILKKIDEENHDQS